MRSTPARAAIGAAWTLVVCAGFGIALAASGMDDGKGAGGPLVAAAGMASPPLAVRYDRDIRPLLSDRCFKCHGPDAAARRAELRLDQFESATSPANGPAPIVPGDVEGSELWRRVNSTDAGEQMPPPGSNKQPLSTEERELMRRWIAGGAKYEQHWSFVPPMRSPVPAVGNAAWCKGDIDRFILAKLESEKIAPSPEADPQTLVRRVFLDLTGLPPTPEETDAYLADAASDKYEKLVDRLLTQEPYRSRTAERLATPWMDAARYADTCGIHTDNGRQMWAWRDWVLAAFRDNMPYDRFVTEQIAGDLLPNATTEQKVASGFNRNHVTTDEGGAIAEEYLVEYAVDRAATTSTTFLGLTMGCARCHDHKFDPISHEDFYSFYAFFNSIDEPGLYTQTPDANRAHEPFMEVPTAEQQTQLAKFGKEVEDLKKLQAATSPEEERDHAAFLAGFPKEAGVTWAATEVLSAKAESAATLTPQPDGSVLASGANPPTDVHEITIDVARDEGNGIATRRLLLLEALEHPSLPHNRIGRADNGNAVLTGIEVDSFPHDDAAPEKVHHHEIEWLWADVSQTNGDFRFTNLLVNNKGSERGWAVDGHMKPGNRHLLVVLKDPIPRGGTDVRVRLRYESNYAQHVLGCVRLTLGNIADTTKLPMEMSNFWLLGPFPNAPSGSPYASTFGPETATTIDFTQNFGSGNQYWRYDANLKDGAPVPLAEGTNISYVGRLICSPTARELPVSLGSDDGLVVFVNGKEVFRHEIERGVMADQDKATLPLQAGVNAVVLKIVNTGGASGYYFRADPKADDSYPHDLVAALLPESCRTPKSAERIKQAWRAARSPAFRERAVRVETLDRDIAQIHTAAPKTMVMKELETPRPTFVLSRGQYDQPDKTKPVTRRVPAALGKMAEGAPANRLGLAQWLVSPENPLASRVAVNRIWEIVFGAGLERTSEDFGYQGEWPSHPELLDFLAADFRESGWDMRRMLRMIVTSATYRQSSAPREDLHERDPDNRLLARAPRRRLAAEQVRDQALYVSGLLAEKFGGPSVKPYQPEGLWKEGALPSSNTQVYERGKGDDLYRRTLYTYWKRAVPPPDLQAFDAPTREYCVVRRPVTSTPLQALVLWNDPAFVEASRVLAQRTMAAGGDDDARIAMLFRRCTGHNADAKELETIKKSLEATRTRFAAAADDAAKLLMVGERPLPENADKPELASWTMIAGAILNLYRTTTQEQPMDPLEQRYLDLTRRRFFGVAGRTLSSGIGSMAFASLLARPGALRAAEPAAIAGVAGAATHTPYPLNFPAKAKRIIYMHMEGAPSQLDLFDYKPDLGKRYDEDLPDSVRQGQRFTGMTSGQRRFPVAPSIFKFTKYDNNQDGIHISELMPHTGSVAKELCFIHSMHTDAINHEPGITFFQTGNQQPGRPAFGSWMSYGLGTANENLPAFVVLISQGFGNMQALSARFWGSGFLPSEHQGCRLRAGADPVLYLHDPPGVTRDDRRRMLDLVGNLNEQEMARSMDPEVRARIAQYELAYRMQMSVPELTDFSGESEETLAMYGPEVKKPGTFAANCLLARRLSERGVRFVQLYMRGWDAHNNLPREIKLQSAAVDQPQAALIKDLKQRGLLDETLVLWAGEFGRTVYSQGTLTKENYGRDHHPRCFTLWLAGGGIKPGITHGKTDDYSYNIVDKPMDVHDLHATMLKVLGIDHEKLIYRHQGRDYRLTDVFGNVVPEILA